MCTIWHVCLNQTMNKYCQKRSRRVHIYVYSNTIFKSPSTPHLDNYDTIPQLILRNTEHVRWYTWFKPINTGLGDCTVKYDLLVIMSWSLHKYHPTYNTSLIPHFNNWNTSFQGTTCNFGHCNLVTRHLCLLTINNTHGWCCVELNTNVYWCDQ